MLSLCTLHARALVSACLLINASLLVASPSIADAPIIFARYKGRTAHIETIGTLFNGKSQVGSGSGLLISAKHVVTNNHVIPLESNYKSLSVNVRLGSRDSIFVSAYKIYRDAERDLALIELEKPLMASGCPLLVAKDPPVTIAEGTALYALGYPVDQDLSITDGILSNKKAAHRRWQMSVLVNPGNSGGPIFTNIGQLIGFSVSGIVQWKIGGELRDVTGVNFLIPISELVSSPIFANLNGIPENERCWDETASAVPLAGPPPTAFQ